MVILFSSLCRAEEGIASYYTVKSNGGTRTASGTPLNDYKLTAAHRSFPLGTKLKVTNTKTNQSVIVTVTDRGPFTRNRIIDLSLEAAKQIGLTSKEGIIKVQIEKA
jgi:rare lipoprotein A